MNEPGSARDGDRKRNWEDESGAAQHKRKRAANRSPTAEKQQSDTVQAHTRSRGVRRLSETMNESHCERRARRRTTASSSSCQSIANLGSNTRGSSSVASVMAGNVSGRMKRVLLEAVETLCAKRVRITNKQRPVYDDRAAIVKEMCRILLEGPWSSRIRVVGTARGQQCMICGAIARGQCRSCERALCIDCAKAGRACAI